MKEIKLCPSCGLKVVHTGDGRFPCAYCGGPLGKEKTK